MSWYLVLGDSARCDLLHVLVLAEDRDGACLFAQRDHGFERIWRVTPARRHYV